MQTKQNESNKNIQYQNIEKMIPIATGASSLLVGMITGSLTSSTVSAAYKPPVFLATTMITALSSKLFFQDLFSVRGDNSHSTFYTNVKIVASDVWEAVVNVGASTYNGVRTVFKDVASYISPHMHSVWEAQKMAEANADAYIYLVNMLKKIAINDTASVLAVGEAVAKLQELFTFKHPLYYVNNTNVINNYSSDKIINFNHNGAKVNITNVNNGTTVDNNNGTININLPHMDDKCPPQSVYIDGYCSPTLNEESPSNGYTDQGKGASEAEAPQAASETNQEQTAKAGDDTIFKGNTVVD